MGVHNRLGRFVMSAIFVQIKNRHRRTKVEIDEESFFTKHSARLKEQYHPYATIVMELNIESLSIPPEETEAAIEGNIRGSDRVVVNKDGLQAYHPSRLQDPAHSRYSTRIRGCSHAVYPVIRPGDETLFDEMLNAKTLFGEHPRQQEIFLEAIERM